MAYGAEHHHKALMTYRTNGRNMSALSRQMGISKPTLYAWKQDGFPVEVTDGEDWDAYLDRIEKEEVQAIKERKLSEEAIFIDEQKERTRQLIDRVHEKVMFSDSVEIKPADFDKLMRLYILLDNREQDKIEFMQAFAAKVIELAVEVMDEQQFTLFRTRLIGLQKAEKDKLGLLPRAT